MSITTAQREILDLAASRRDGKIDRHDFDMSRFRSIKLLIERGYLRVSDQDGVRKYEITAKGYGAVK
jgi:hypothetical protein